MKSTPDFHFKQFSIKQERSSHKVGTDGVLLGAWVDVSGVSRVLDIGTGTGLIALMLAQRTEPSTTIDAVEIEPDDARQAVENVSNSPWPNKVSVFNQAVQNFEASNLYDLIVSNPPYFQNSWLPPEDKRSQARHTHQLSFDELLQSSARLLTSEGKLAVILPYQEALDFIARSKLYHLSVVRRMDFHSRANKPVERILIELCRGKVQNEVEKLILYGNSDNWSEEYRILTKEFYLKV